MTGLATQESLKSETLRAKMSVELTCCLYRNLIYALKKNQIISRYILDTEIESLYLKL